MLHYFFAGIILSSCEKDLDISQTNVNGELLSISLNSLNLEMLDRMSEGDTLFFTPNFENNDIFQKRGFSTRPGMYENEVYGYFTKQTVRMKFYRRPDGSTVVPYYLCDFPDFHLYEKYTIEIKIPLTANQAARGFVGPKSGWEGATLNYQMPHQDEKKAPTNDGLILKNGFINMFPLLWDKHILTYLTFLRSQTKPNYITNYSTLKIKHLGYEIKN